MATERSWQSLAERQEETRESGDASFNFSLVAVCGVFWATEEDGKEDPGAGLGSELCRDNVHTVKLPHPFASCLT